MGVWFVNHDASITFEEKAMDMINNGNRTEWQAELDDKKSCYQLIINIAISENKETMSKLKKISPFWNSLIFFG